MPLWKHDPRVLRDRAFPLCWTALAVGLLATQPPAPVRAQNPEPTGLQVAAAIESVIVDAIAQAEKSVVAIARVKRGERQALEPPFNRFGQLSPSPPPKPGDPDFVPNDYGTGVVVDRRGLVLTHYHLLGEDSDHYVTTPAHKVLRATIKAADPRSDLAVLSIEDSGLTPIKFGDASTLKKGQFVIALGNPFAIARDGEASASWGIVANLARKAPRHPERRGPAAEDDVAPIRHFDPDRCPVEPGNKRRRVDQFAGRDGGFDHGRFRAARLRASGRIRGAGRRDVSSRGGDAQAGARGRVWLSWRSAARFRTKLPMLDSPYVECRSSMSFPDRRPRTAG